MSNTLSDPIIVCPDCGAVHEIFEATCTTCLRDLSTVDPIDRSALNVVLNLPAATQYKLVNISLSDDNPDGKEVMLPDGDGEYVLGRSSGSSTPDVDLKEFTTAFVSKNTSDPNYGLRQRGISRSHAVLVRQGDEFKIYRHWNADPRLVVKVNGEVILGESLGLAWTVKPGDRIQLGDVFAPGVKEKAPGVVVRLEQV